MSILIKKAADIAAVAHKGQERKQGRVPYIAHPAAVAIILARHGFSEEVIAAALVHDVLEDTDFPESELRAAMGEEVMAIIGAVTNDDSLSWEEKKQKYIESVRAGSEEVKAVATADKIHNMQDLLETYEKEGPAVWEYFNQGKEKKVWFEEAMLAMLKETWNHPLVAEYEKLVERMRSLD
jgi:(p)ppGpp synthase/HD superfamily hydrolase